MIATLQAINIKCEWQ